MRPAGYQGGFHHQLFRCLCPAQGPLESSIDVASDDVRVVCLSCRKARVGIKAWNDANIPAPVQAPEPYVDPDAVTFKDFTVPLPDSGLGGFVTAYKRWYVVCVPGQLPHLIDGMTGERVELKP